MIMKLKMHFRYTLERKVVGPAGKGAGNGRRLGARRRHLVAIMQVRPNQITVLFSVRMPVELGDLVNLDEDKGPIPSPNASQEKNLVKELLQDDLQPAEPSAVSNKDDNSASHNNLKADNPKKPSLMSKFKSAAKGIKNATKSTKGEPVEQEAEKFSTPNQSSSQAAKYFGVPLMSFSQIPDFLEAALKFLENATAASTEGVFRISGSKATIEACIEKIDRGDSIKFTDVHTATGLVKQYLRTLPEPVITTTLFDAFYDTVLCKDEDEKMERMRLLIDALPDIHKVVLKRVLRTLCYLSAFEEKTMMGALNLATVVGPNLGWAASIEESESGNSGHQMAFISSSKATAITLYLIDNLSEVFQEPKKYVGLGLREAYLGEEDGSRSFTFLRNGDGQFYGSALDGGELVEEPVDLAECIIIHWISHCQEISGEIAFETNIISSSKSLNDSHQGILNSQESIKSAPASMPLYEHDIRLMQPASLTNVAIEDPEDVKSVNLSWIISKVDALQAEVHQLRSSLQEEARKREELSQVVPFLMRNQDEVLSLLQSLNISKG